MKEKHKLFEVPQEGLFEYPVEETVIRGKFTQRIKTVCNYVLERTVIRNKTEELSSENATNVTYIETYLEERGDR